MYWNNYPERCRYEFSCFIVLEYQTVVSKKTHDQNIIGESAVETLKYSYLHKLTVEFPDDSKSDPQFTNLVKKFGLCDKQSLMVMINVNSELEKWANVEQLLTAKVFEFKIFFISSVYEVILFLKLFIVTFKTYRWFN